MGTSSEAHGWTDPGRAGLLYVPKQGMFDLGTLIVDPPEDLDPRTLIPTAITDPAAGKNFGQICGTVMIGGIDVAFVLVPNN